MYEGWKQKKKWEEWIWNKKFEKFLLLFKTITFIPFPEDHQIYSIVSERARAHFSIVVIFCKMIFYGESNRKYLAHKYFEEHRQKLSNLALGKCMIFSIEIPICCQIFKFKYAAFDLSHFSNPNDKNLISLKRHRHQETLPWKNQWCILTKNVFIFYSYLTSQKRRGTRLHFVEG